VLVDVYTDWCGWCKRMDADVFSRADVREYLSAHFVTVRLNAESGELATWQGRDYSARTLASAFNVTGYPTTLFFTSKGEHLVNVPGYIPAERFLLLLRYIGDGHLERNEKWDDYVKQVKGGH
jgi:thioredoxin-related protein